MKRAQSSASIAIVLAAIAGTSLADTRPPAREPAIDTRELPLECGLFLVTPADSRSEVMPWAQRLSIAACRQQIALTPIDDPERFPAMIETLQRAMEPSIAIYRDAMARGPAEIQILAAYGLGMTHVNIIVRARGAIRIAERRALHGDAAYRGTLNREQVLRRGLEALLRREREEALAAFRVEAMLADQYPAAARANLVMSVVLADGRQHVPILQR